MYISAKSFDFLVNQEDGSETYYDRTEAHFDWPGGASGPTVAIGYDLGYVTVNECINDWTGIIPHDTIGKMIEGVQLTGERAHLFVQTNRTEVTITWAEALQEFTERELPKWEHRMELALPNWGLLTPDCKGALLSLGYNRGTGGFNSNLPRYTEMAQIRVAMAHQQLAQIPGLIRGMVRLWPNSSDLRRRRVLEAQLFAEGLDTKAPVTSSPQPATPPAPVARPSPAAPPPSTQEPPVGDTVKEIEDVIEEVSHFLPTISGIIGAFVPGAGPLLTIASPFLSITNEILSAIETLKGAGMTHQAAAATIGAVVSHIGATITATVPPQNADAAEPGIPAPNPGTIQHPTSIPAPHETH